ncbi:hypothetical protein [Pseudomonas oryzihabitans]|uniref:hypothetical protein n=1 Tax=Pseudomonas oryzihabitans TaxID=47885 RepID=UPI0030BD511C
MRFSIEAKNKWIAGVSLISLFVLFMTAIRAPIWSVFLGTTIESVLTKESWISLWSSLSSGVVAAYLFYFLVEVVPKRKSDQQVREVLDSAVASVVEGLLEGGAFQHEKELQYVSLDLRKVDWQREIDLCSTRDFIRLKFAGETAETRFDYFKGLISVTVQLSPMHTKIWLGVTEKFRLYVETMAARPASFDVRTLHGTTIDELVAQGNADGLWVSSLQFRAHEYLELARDWTQLR